MLLNVLSFKSYCYVLALIQARRPEVTADSTACSSAPITHLRPLKPMNLLYRGDHQYRIMAAQLLPTDVLEVQPSRRQVPVPELSPRSRMAQLAFGLH